MMPRGLSSAGPSGRIALGRPRGLSETVRSGTARRRFGDASLGLRYRSPMGLDGWTQDRRREQKQHKLEFSGTKKQIHMTRLSNYDIGGPL